jgi:hypothetical protein
MFGGDGSANMMFTTIYVDLHRHLLPIFAPLPSVADDSEETVAMYRE